MKTNKMPWTSYRAEGCILKLAENSWPDQTEILSAFDDSLLEKFHKE